MHSPANEGISTRRSTGLLHRVVDLPEANIAMFAFLLNFVWEFLQVPFFERIPSLPHWDGIMICTVAAAGDAMIMLLAFWSVAVVVRTRRWILRPDTRQLAGFVGVGLLITIIIEVLATSSGRWEYSDTMPVILGIGFVPLLQWILLPLLTAWFVRRQLT